MKIQIMGAGALGCLIGALIQLASYDVVFVARSKQYKALKKSLRISGLMEVEMKVDVADKPKNADITFVTVKAYDTENAGKLLAEVEPGIVCSLQNGIGNEEILQKYCEKVLGGVTSYGANLITYGHVKYAGKGYTYVGEMSSKMSEEAEIVAEVLRKSGMKAEAVEDIPFRLWAKAVVNAAINPITALCRVKNGRIVEDSNLWRVAKEAAKEGEEVMKRMGFKFDAVSEVRKVAEMTAENRSSMLQDIERGKRTEVDFINGAIVKRGEELGVDCRTNRILTLLVKGAEYGFG